MISRVLDAIDDLVENNRRRIELLEQMAEAIYREWFVRFRYPGHESDKLIDSPLGPIPSRVTPARLGDVASVNAESRRPMDDEEIRYLDISSLGDRTLSQPSLMAGADAPGRARRVVHPGDVVWSMVRPNRRAHVLLVEPGSDWIASTGLAVLTPTRTSSAYLFEAVSHPSFCDYLVSRQSGAAYPAVKPVDFRHAPLLLPDPDLDARFAEIIDNHHRLVWTLRDSSERLALLRDLLLPRLVSGQIDVSHLDPDELIGSVA